MTAIDRRHLATEQRNDRSRNIDRLSVEDVFDIINAEDASVPAAVAAAKGQICDAINIVVQAFRSGGRLFYVGAGTSGRLGVLDAAECPPTFLTHPKMIQGIIAGGFDALTRSIEGAEDSYDDGAAVINAKDIAPNDVVFGIATGGTTPYVHGAIDRAKQLGAKTIFLACIPADQLTDNADVSIRVNTGPEVVTGSTRMKAGTATKLVLNTITTSAMIRIGKVHQNLMVDVNADVNDKLRDRGARIVSELTELSREQAAELLERAGGRVKTAIVMHRKAIAAAEANELIDQADGRLADVV